MDSPHQESLQYLFSLNYQVLLLLGEGGLLGVVLGNKTGGWE